MGRILSIDYGLKRCGLAVTDPLQLIARPLETVENEGLKPYLIRFVKEEDVESFVVGMPYNMDGSRSQMIETIEVFQTWLRLTFPKLAIHEVDERLTSIEAKKIIVQSVKSKKKRRDKGLVDRISASIILESFLNRKNTGELRL